MEDWYDYILKLHFKMVWIFDLPNEKESRNLRSDENKKKRKKRINRILKKVSNNKNVKMYYLWTEIVE